VLLDQLPANALAGVVAVPVVTADIQSQADTADQYTAAIGS
jgi:FMN reductase